MPTFGQGDLDPLAPRVIPPAEGTTAPSATFGANDLDPLAPIQEPAKSARRPMEKVGRYLDDLARSVASGVMGGYADELNAYAKSGPSPESVESAVGFTEAVTGQPVPKELVDLSKRARRDRPSYSVTLQKEQARDEEIPWWLKVPGEVTGAAAGSVLAAPLVTGSKVAQVFTQLPRWLQATGLGSLYGALFGSGHAKEGERLVGGAIGAGTGALTGVATYGATTGAYRGYRGVRDMVKSRLNPNEYARELLARAMVRDETTGPMAAQQLKGLGPKAMLADVGGRATPGGEIVGGENVLGLARATATMPGAGKSQGAIKLAVRAEAEGKRIGQAVHRYLDPQDYFLAEDALLKKLSDVGRQAYQPAFEKFKEVQFTPALKRFLKESPDAQAAIRNAAANAARLRAAGESKFLGPIDEELTALARYARDLGKMPRGAVPREGVIKNFSLETWHEVREGLQRLLDSKQFTNELTGKVNKAGYAVLQEIKRLTKELGAATGGEKSPYLAANAEYRGTAEALEALRAGRDFMKMAPEVVQRTLADLSEAGRAAFRSGAARAFMENAERVADQGSVAQKLFGNELMRKRLAALDMGEGGKLSPAWADFAGRLRAEQRFGRTAREIRSGSRTTPLLAEQADALRRGAGTVAAVIGSHSPLGHPLVTSRIARETAMRAVGMKDNPKLLQELGRLLFSQNRANQLGALDTVTALVKAGRLPHDRQAELLAEFLAAGAGSQESQVVRPAIAGAASQLGPAAAELFK